MKTERLPIDSQPPWDCINQNETCPWCKGENASDHGVGGSHVWLAVKITHDEHEYAVTMAILGKDVLPVTKAWWKERGLGPDSDSFAHEVLSHHMAADISVHRKVEEGGRECRWLGRCEVLATSAMHAMDMFKEYGDTNADHDPKEQPDALWSALTAWGVAEVERFEVELQATAS